MDTLYARCAGLDVHKDTVVACVRVVNGTEVRRQVRTFGTTTRALSELHDWLLEQQVTRVAMEATGIYWRPVWHLLEEGLDLVLANAAHIRQVPGRKTDVNDATWIADLLAHGLIRPSFVPPTPIQELRDLVRTRKQLVRDRSSHTQRIQKVLEDANIKLSSYLTDLLGKSGRAILDALVEGQTRPELLVALADVRVKASRAELVEALRGRVTSHHRFLLRMHLRAIDQLNLTIAEVEARAGEALQPFQGAVEQLRALPGISETAAHMLVAEIGTDMSRFPSAAHLISWAGLCPKNDESAGKRRSTRLRKGSAWLKTTMVQAGWAAIRKKDSYFGALFRRIKSRRGAGKAIVAVAASLLTTAYHLLRDGTVFKDLGAGYFDTLQTETKAYRIVRRLEAMGYQVEVKKVA